jgi:hypothetical protein
MRPTLIFIFLFSISSFGQQIDNSKLYRSVEIQQSGKKEASDGNEFAFIKGENLFILRFRSLLNMENGEVIIKTSIDTLSIEKTNFNVTSEQTFDIQFPEFKITFQSVQEVESKAITIEKTRDLLIGNTFVKISNDDNKKPTVTQTYQSNGKAKYQTIGSSSNWSTDYSLIEFHGFVIVKGINSSPILVTSITEKGLNGITTENGKKVELILEDHWTNPDLDKVRTEKPYEIQLAQTPNSQCISELPEKILQTSIGVAKGIKEKQLSTVQVQHSYDCDWMLFHDSRFDGFAKMTVEELLIQDSSLCHIFSIPCGYYAERKNAQDSWYVYLHEERIETDSTFIIKKAFQWDNTYRVINEYKNEDKVYYEDYYLDTRILKKTWTYVNSKEVGITRFYDENGKLVKEVNNDTGETTTY